MVFSLLCYIYLSYFNIFLNIKIFKNLFLLKNVQIIYQSMVIMNLYFALIYIKILIIKITYAFLMRKYIFFLWYICLSKYS